MEKRLEERIDRIEQWLKEVEDYTTSHLELTKKERNYYLDESLKQIEVVRVLKEILNEN